MRFITPRILRGALLLITVASVLPAVAQRSTSPSRRRPNVVLIITDDQGYGDLGFHGNPKISTPNLDRLARQSVQFQSFYVSPVCAPTRASLMTGRYNYRTGVVDTYLGRSLMHPDETTLAEMLSSGGYRTGIFGKWHLGDNYPMRAIDQGFQTSLTLNGGGIGQPSDPVGGERYFDAILSRNGRWEKTKGYVSDVITDGAIEFIANNRSRPFFAYLAFNAPHTPLEVPAEKYAKYKEMNLRAEDLWDG
jgi:arylsulfatase A-like enzyme